jgi:hypothetical protein
MDSEALPMLPLYLNLMTLSFAPWLIAAQQMGSFAVSEPAPVTTSTPDEAPVYSAQIIRFPIERTRPPVRRDNAAGLYQLK